MIGEPPASAEMAERSPLGALQEVDELDDLELVPVEPDIIKNEEEDDDKMSKEEWFTIFIITLAAIFFSLLALGSLTS